MSYTNVLQSILIVPTMQHSGRTFDEMIEQNYTFATADFKFFQTLSIPMSTQYGSIRGGGNKRFKMLERQEQLLDRIVQRNPKRIPDFYALVEEYSEGQNKVFMLDKKGLPSFGLLLPPKGRWQMVVGTDEFLSIPIWWRFGNVERGSLLAESLERFKQAGFLSYFLRLHDSKLFAWGGAYVRRQQITLADAVPTNSQEPFGPEWRVTLMDGVTSEAFVIFLYGMIAAKVGFGSEMAIKASKRKLVDSLRTIRCLCLELGSTVALLLSRKFNKT